MMSAADAPTATHVHTIVGRAVEKPIAHNGSTPPLSVATLPPRGTVGPRDARWAPIQMAEAPAEGAPEGLGLAGAWRSLTAHIKLPDLALREPDAWQILYDLRTEEAAVPDRPSPMEVRAMPVSYTHLTLPTILLV